MASLPSSVSDVIGSATRFDACHFDPDQCSALRVCPFFLSLIRWPTIADTVANMVRFFWVLAAVIFLLAGVGLFGENLIIGAALGGAALCCVVFGMVNLGGGARDAAKPDADTSVDSHV